MGSSPTPRNRPARSARSPLSREAIIRAAIELMDSDADDHLTMRRLAAQLETGPASLYAYVRDTAELHAHILDHKLSALDLGWDPDEVLWSDRLSGILMAYVELLLRYPELARSAMQTRPTGENYLALVESLLALLVAGGAPIERAAWGVVSLLQSATATAVEVGTRRRSEGAPVEWEALTAAVRDATPERFPMVAELGLELMSGAGPDRAAWSFSALANGIVATPRPSEGS